MKRIWAEICSTVYRHDHRLELRMLMGCLAVFLSKAQDSSESDEAALLLKAAPCHSTAIARWSWRIWPIILVCLTLQGRDSHNFNLSVSFQMRNIYCKCFASCHACLFCRIHKGKCTFWKRWGHCCYEKLVASLQELSQSSTSSLTQEHMQLKENRWIYRFCVMFERKYGGCKSDVWNAQFPTRTISRKIHDDLSYHFLSCHAANTNMIQLWTMAS